MATAGADHPDVALAPLGEAAAHAELVVNATSGSGAVPVLEEAGADHAGKVLIDISNLLDFSQGLPTTLFVQDTDSLGEQIQRAFPQAKVVKILNTLKADLMVQHTSLGAETSVLVSGDDAEAKATVTELLESFGHTDVIDLGDVGTARGTERYLPLWLRLMGALGTAAFNVTVVR